MYVRERPTMPTVPLGCPQRPPVAEPYTGGCETPQHGGCLAGVGGLGMIEARGARRVVVILIHGTWAPNAPWTQPDSWFRDTLSDALSSRGIVAPEIDRIGWSGANTHAARAEGSLRLSDKLLELQVDVLDLCILVGHSHGGNVALHAIVHDDAVRDVVDGVVTLATPFLLFRPESPLVARLAAGLDRSAMAAAAWAAVPIIAFVATLPFLLLFHSILEWRIAWINWLRNGLVHGCSWIWASTACRSTINGVTGMISAAFAILVTLVILLMGQFEGEEEHKAQREGARESVARLAYLQPSERLSRTSILTMSAPVDEALQILNASWWAHRVRIWLLRLAVTLSIAAGTGATMATLFRIGMYEQSLVGTNAYTLISSTAVAFAKVTLIPLAFALGALVGAVVRLAASLPAMGLGSENARDNLHWTVHASRHLTGAPLAANRSYGLLGLLRNGGPLIHSRIYRSERAVEEIADFISERQYPLAGAPPWCPS